MAIYKYNREVELEAPEKNISWQSEWDLNPGPIDLKCGTLTTQPYCLYYHYALQILLVTSKSDGQISSLVLYITLTKSDFCPSYVLQAVPGCPVLTITM